MLTDRTSIVPSFDVPAALVCALAAGIAANQQHVPIGGLHQIWTLRINLVNVCFLAGLVLLWTRAADVSGLNRSDLLSPSQALLRAVRLCLLATVAVVGYRTLRHGAEPMLALALSFLSASVAYFAIRIGMTHPQLGSREHKRQVVILGTGRRASRAWRELRVNRSRTYDVIGFVDDRDPLEAPPDIAARFLTTPDNLAEYLLHNVVDDLVIAVPAKSCYEMAQQAILIAESVGIRVHYLHDIYTLSRSSRAQCDLFMELTPVDHYYRFCQSVKRVVDFVLAFVLLLVLSPVFLVLAIVVKLTSDGPVFFSQERFGYHRRVFRMFKFRSMVKEAPAMLAAIEAQNEAVGPIFKVRNDPRITPLGRFIRKTSLDELPQLWNVVLGDMSLVGPRPMSKRDVSKFNNSALMRRFSVRPGMTGSWQVFGRGSLHFDDWVRLDFRYIETWSLGLDFKLLLQTVPALLRRSGAA